MAIATAVAAPVDSPNLEKPADRAIGRPVRIVTLSFAAGRDAREIASLVEREAAKGTDLVVLPETWTGKNPESLTGPATSAMADLARRYRTYIVSPVYRLQGSDCFNSAVLLDREGKVAGIYNKVFPFPPEYLDDYHGLPNLKCGSEAGVFATDFGKIGLAICFDVNFPELWQQMADQGAEMVVWPSAYPGGFSLQAQAALHHYYVVSATHNARATMNCPVYDISGEPITSPDIPETKTGEVTIARFTLDLDRTLFGTDYGHFAQAQRLAAEHPHEIVIEKSLPHEGVFIMKAIAPGVSVLELTRRAGLPTLREMLGHDRKELTQRRGFDFGRADNLPVKTSER